MTPVAWDPDFAARSPLFEPLRAIAGGLPRGRWPDAADLQRLATARRIATRSGAALTFVAPQSGAKPFDERYEPRIYRRGEMALRAGNWHDLLNALVWLTFPLSKAALNARHYRESQARRGRSGANRGKVEDALTLFDEGGVIVASADASLTRLLAGFGWKQLFWARRADVLERMRFVVFGHALYEKALAPFSGVTGRGIAFQVEPDFLRAPPGEQAAGLDRRLARHLEDAAALQTTRELMPVPVLGVPGWFVANESACYYDDVAYFRPGRVNRPGSA